MALFTLPELASYLQRDLDTATATLALAAGTAAVENYLGRKIESTTYTAQRNPVIVDEYDSFVPLPASPVTAVASVSIDLAGVVTPLAVNVSYWWDGISPRLRLAPVALLQRFVTPWSVYLDPMALVTYTAGWAVVPEDIKAVALSVASRTYANPEGIRSEAIDDYSRTRAGSDDDLSGFGLTNTERMILNRYRQRAGTVRVR